ncbi:MAG: TonB-dependent receptor, partial [Gammaproteobacteria bacterium]|nr:TonB-dependent receptor [Gammaproteobacteria bacterium]
MRSHYEQERGPAARLIQLAMIAAIAAIAPYWAQAAGPQAEAAEPTNATAAPEASNDALEQVVVTATATGVRKLDASFTITSVSAEDIKQANPKSTADLLKVSPGLWPESSGGQTGANIE